MFSKVFLFDMLERAVKTVAQVILAMLTLDGANILTIDWKQAITTAVTAGVISLLTSVVSSGLRDRGTASLVVNPPVAPPNDTDSLRG